MIKKSHKCSKEGGVYFFFLAKQNIANAGTSFLNATVLFHATEGLCVGRVYLFKELFRTLRIFCIYTKL